MSKPKCAHVITVHELVEELTPIEPEPGTAWAGDPPMERKRTGRWICPNCGLMGVAGEEPTADYADIVRLFHRTLDAPG